MAVGRTVIKYPDAVYIIVPDGDIIDQVLACPGIDVRALLDWLVSVHDARVTRRSVAPPPSRSPIG